MSTSEYFQNVNERAAFAADAHAKLDCFRSNRLFVGLNCFLVGQSQRVHAHDAADKLYFVIRGRATVTVGEERRAVETGELIWAPAGAPHGVPETFEDTVLLVVMAPPPVARPEARPAT